MSTVSATLIRPLRPRDPHEPHRVASPLELLTDLCFVVAVAQAAAGLHHAISEDHLLAGLGGFAMAFFAIYWAWLNFTWFASAYDNDDVVYRLLTIGQIIGVLVLAAGIPGLIEGHYGLPVLGYLIMRLALVAQWLRAARDDPERRLTCRRYALLITAVQVLWIGWVFVPHALAVPVFLVLVVAELVVPMLAERPAATPWHPHHVAERYGLFFIIVLGETILSTTVAIQQAATGEGLALGTLILVAGSGVLIVFGSWWLYFARSAAQVLDSARDDNSHRQYIWGFGHYVIFAAAAAVGAGLAARVDYWNHAAHASALGSALGVAVPVAVLLVVLWVIQLRRHDPSLRTAVPFLLAALLVLLGIVTPVPELVAGVVVAVLVAVEVRVAALGPATSDA